MQTILGATGQIAVELARELRRNYNAIEASRAAGARFVYFDNTYRYPQDARVLTEDASFAPVGRKGRVRAAMASRVLQEMARGDIPVLIGRVPEFYGPARTQSITNTLVIDNIRAGRKPRVPVRDDTRRMLIWTPDASRARRRSARRGMRLARPGICLATTAASRIGNSWVWRRRSSLSELRTKSCTNGRCWLRGRFPGRYASCVNCCRATRTTISLTRQSSSDAFPSLR